MTARLLGVGEATSRLDHQFDPDFAPRNRGRILRLENAQLLAVDGDSVLGCANVGIEATIGRVVFQKMSERFVRCEVVDGHDLEQITESAIVNGLVDLPADTSKSIDAYANCHGSPHLL